VRGWRFARVLRRERKSFYRDCLPLLFDLKTVQLDLRLFEPDGLKL